MRHRDPRSSIRRRRIVVAGAAVAAAVVAGIAVVTTASATNPGSSCTGTAPDENGHVRFDCVIPMPDRATVTTPVPSPTTVTETVTSPAPPTSTGTTTSNPTTTTTSTRPPTSNPTTAPGGTVHGKDINASNTGVQPGACAQMQVYSSRMKASQIGNRSCVDLRGGLTVDTAITLEQSIVRGPVGGDGARLTLRWVTVDGAGSGEYGVYHRVDCYRCNITGASDGVRFSGTNLVESYVRVKQVSSADHNDGVQAYLGSDGGSILRSNIDTRPVNAGNCGNAAIFIADNSKGEIVIRDNWLGGGGYTLRLHESAKYRVTGNIMSGWCFGPVNTTNAVSGAFLEWSNNRTSSGTVVNP